MNSDDKIDFVIIWVDGNDKNWQEEKRKYENNINANNDSREIRYRDWDNLQYWFRGVEKFAPWVNKIHFVTWGHLPKWLNTDNEKLNIVKHEDFIPCKYLPTFSANPIENNLYRIRGLSENFVYFNDDMFITNKVKPTDFFYKGKPRDAALLNANISYRKNRVHIEAANMDVINDYFDKNTVLKNNFFKWFNLKYGKQLIRTFCLLPWNAFPGILNAHLPNSFKKSTFEEVWEKEYETLDRTCMNKFRYELDVNQWLFEDWQICSGNFVPRSTKFGRSFTLCDDDKYNEKVYKYLKHQKYKVMCINDMILDNERYEKEKASLNKTFDGILPDKSSFEI